MSEREVDPRDGSPADEAPGDEPSPGPAEAVEGPGDDAGGAAPEGQDLLALAQRVQADFENYRKRVVRDQAELVERANERLVEQLLPVLDSFELAVVSLDQAEERVRKGVELVFAELVGVLERAGLERIETDGVPFDPNVHEAVLHEEGDGEPVVTETMRPGYRWQRRVLRPAMVRVGTRRDGPGPTGPVA